MDQPEFKYTTWGPVRGSCGHRHKAYRTAAKCKEKDTHAVTMHSLQSRAYSDRVVYRIEGDRAYPADPGGGIKDRDGEANGRPAADVLGYQAISR